MLWALTEGLAGVVDRGCGFDRADVSPRWLAAEVENAEVAIGYACSDRGVRYQFRARDDKVRLGASAAGSDIRFHVLLPRGAQARSVRRDGRDIAFRSVVVGESTYADFDGRVDGEASFEIALR